MSEELKEVLFCDRCHKGLLGYSCTVTTYNSDQSLQKKEVICFDCNRRDRELVYEETGRLSSNLMHDIVMDNLSHRTCWKFIEKAKNDLKRLEAIASTFLTSVWQVGGLQRYIHESNWSGHSMKTPLVKALSLSTAGRVLITLSDKNDNSITLIGRDEASPSGIGIQSIDATCDQAVQILEYFIKYVRRYGLKFKIDKKVSIW